MECEFSNIQQGHVSRKVTPRRFYSEYIFIFLCARDLARNLTFKDNEHQRFKTINLDEFHFVWFEKIKDQRNLAAMMTQFPILITLN